MRITARDATTSKRLAAQRQANTRTELAIGAELSALGVRYRKNVRKLPGSPDFANIRRRWAIFVNGCFWHHHRGCKRATIPKNNRAFWESKFAANRARDAGAALELRRRGFKVLILWECQVSSSQGRLGRLQSHCKDSDVKLKGA